MTLSLEWHASPLSSTLYHAMLAPPSSATLPHDGLPAAASQWVHECAGEDDAIRQQLVESAIAMTAMHEDVGLAATEVAARMARLSCNVPPAQIAENLERLHHEVTSVRPQLAAELEARRRPIQMQWEALGPGLWRAFEKATETHTSNRSAHVILVEPMLHGHACPLPAADAVIFEAILTNIDDRLPEVLRLVWVLACADKDRQSGSELIPLVLQAAEELGMLKADLATIELAEQLWRFEEKPVRS